MSEIEQGRAAKTLLDNPAFNAAFTHVREAIIRRIEECPMSERDMADEFRKCLRLLRDLRFNLEGAVRVGKLAEFRLEHERQTPAEKETQRELLNMDRIRNYFTSGKVRGIFR